MPSTPATAYSAIAMTERFSPSAAPESSTANVCPLTGTGVPGTGTLICAAMPTNTAAPTTSATSRTSRPGTRSTKTAGRATAAWVLDTWNLPFGGLTGTIVASGAGEGSQRACQRSVLALCTGGLSGSCGYRPLLGGLAGHRRHGLARRPPPRRVRPHRRPDPAHGVRDGRYIVGRRLHGG